jgi:hypothetical protein
MSKYIINVPRDIFSVPSIREYDEDEIKDKAKDEIREELYDEIKEEIVSDIQNAADDHESELDSMLDRATDAARDVNDALETLNSIISDLESETAFRVEDHV